MVKNVLQANVEARLRREISDASRRGSSIVTAAIEWFVSAAALVIALPFLSRMDGPWPILGGFLILIAVLVLVPGAATLAAAIASSQMAVRRERFERERAEFQLAELEQVMTAVVSEVNLPEKFKAKLEACAETVKDLVKH